jgi:hypothetical protein
MKVQGSDESPPLSGDSELSPFLPSLPLICDCSVFLLAGSSGPSLDAQEVIKYDINPQIMSLVGFMILKFESMTSPSGLHEDKLPLIYGCKFATKNAAGKFARNC